MILTNKQIVQELYDRDLLSQEDYIESIKNPAKCKKIVEIYRDCFWTYAFESEYPEEMRKNIAQSKIDIMIDHIMSNHELLSGYLYQQNILGVNDCKNIEFTYKYIMNNEQPIVWNLFKRIVDDIYSVYELNNKYLCNISDENNKLFNGYLAYWELSKNCIYGGDVIPPCETEEELEYLRGKEDQYIICILHKLIQEFDTDDFGRFAFNILEKDEKKTPTK